MIRKATWIMLAVFVLLFAVTIVLQSNPTLLRNGDEPTPSPTSQALMVEGWQSNDIAWIELKDHQGNILRVIQGATGGWLLDSEDGVSANSGLVEEVRSQIAAVRTQVNLEPDFALEAVGLNEPAQTLTIRSLNGREAVIHIGQSTPTGSGYYVQVDNKAPAVVSKFSIDDILSNLQREQLVSLEAFPTLQP